MASVYSDQDGNHSKAIENKPKAKNGPEAVTVDFRLIDWPEIDLTCPFGDVLQWLISDVLADPILDLCGRGRIHIIKKPRSRLERYLVIGGLQEYLTLQMGAWDGDTMAMLWSNVSQDEAKAWFFRNLQRMLFGLRAGPVASAVRAALLVELSKASIEPILSESKSEPKISHFAIKAPPRMLAHRSHGLLKEISGFDRRSYMRTRKDGAPAPVLRWVDSMLGLATHQDDEFDCHGS